MTKTLSSIIRKQVEMIKLQNEVIDRRNLSIR